LLNGIVADLEGPSVGSVLWNLLTRPYDTFILLWNWKAALLSSVGRAPIFLVITLGHGWRRASLAMLVEAAFRASSTGFFAAATQAFVKAKPKWMALALMLTGFPLLTLALDGLLHRAMHTPNLLAGMIVSLFISGLASTFDFYSMQRGTLLVGREGNSFGSDLKALPQLILGFVLEPPVWAWRLTLQRLLRSEAIGADGD
jgi:hypothetical protein